MSLEHNVQLLQRVALFDVLEIEQLQLLAFNAERRPVRAGEILFEEGAPASSAFIIIEGEVSQVQVGASSPNSVRYFGPGTIIGELSIISNSNRPATARAESNGEVFVISRQLFHRVLEEFPETAVRIHEKIVARLRVVVGDLVMVRPLFDDAV